MFSTFDDFLSLISAVHSWMQGVSHFLGKVEKTQQDVMYQESNDE